MLENDPYYKMNNKSHKLKGKPGENDKKTTNNQDNGISWGIVDEEEIYAW